jgi:hypothetical protein
MAISLISSGDGGRLLAAARTAASVLYKRSRQKAVNNVQKSVEKPGKSDVSRPEKFLEVKDNKEDTAEN